MDLRKTIDSELNLSYELKRLNDSELKQIYDVIKRDAILRNEHLQHDKLKILRQEIEQLESESVDIPNEHKKTANFCIRCKENFSFGFNYFYYSLLGQAEICPKCNHKVCTKCKVFENNNIEYKWVCKLCHKKSEYKQLILKTGDWIKDEKLVQTSKKKSLNMLNGSQIVEISLDEKRAIEINDELNKDQNKLFKSYSDLKNEINSNLLYKKNEKLNFMINNTKKNRFQQQQQNQTSKFAEVSTVNLQQKNIKLFKDLTNNNNNTKNYENDSIRKYNIQYFENQIKNAKTNLRPISVSNADDLNSLTSSNLSSLSEVSTITANFSIDMLRSRFDDNGSMQKNKFNGSDNIGINKNKFVNDNVSIAMLKNKADENEIISLQKNKLNNSIDNISNANLTITNDIYPTQLSAEKSDKLFQSETNISINSKNSKLDDDIDAYFKKDLSINKKEEEEEDFKINEIVTDEQIKSKSMKYYTSFKKLSRTISQPRNESMKNMFQHHEMAKIILKIDFDRKSSNLIVRIVKCENLYDSKNFAYDPYVKMYLMLKDDEANSSKKIEKISDKEKKQIKRKTSIARNTHNPSFDEVFRYVIAFDDLKNYKLNILVCHNDKFGRNKILGEIVIPLKQEDFSKLDYMSDRVYEFEKCKTGLITQASSNLAKKKSSKKAKFIKIFTI